MGSGRDDSFPGGARGKCPAYDGYSQTLGAAGNSITTPSSAATQITGDIDLDGKILPPTWGSTVMVIGKDNNTAPREYGLHMTALGVRFFYTPDGSTTRVADSTVLPSTVFSTGQAGWVRATYANATGTVTFYTSSDGINWTQLGTPVVITSGLIFSSTATVGVGGNPIVSQTCSVYRARIYSGFRQSAGVLKADFDPTRWTTGNTITAVTGEVWTANGTAAFRYT